MNFVCSKEKLLESLNIVSKAVPNRTTKPILECILITVTDKGFKLLANDMEMAIESLLVECEVMETGTICIEAKILTDIIRSLPDSTVSIKSDSNNVTIIKSGKSEFKILGLSGDEFPPMPEVEKYNCYEIYSADLRNMIKQTVFSVSSDESRIVLNGEFFDIKDGFLNLVAVDGFRVSLRRIEFLNSGVDTGVIVPYKAMSELSKILSSEPELKTYIYTTDKHVLFETESLVMVSRLIEGEFMNYQQIFSEDFDTKIVVDRVEFIGCLERSSIISDAKKNPIKLEIKPEWMIVTTNNELGTTYEEINIDIEGNPLEIAFNPRYMIDALKAIEDEEVEILFTTALSPCIIKGLVGDNYKYLVLPLRLRN